MTRNIDYAGVVRPVNPVTVPGTILALDARSPSNVFDSTSAPTTAALLADLSGNGFNFIQPVKTLQPVLQNAATNNAGILFDGDQAAKTNVDRIYCPNNAAFNGGSTATILLVVTPDSVLPVTYPHIFTKYNWSTGIGWAIRNSNVIGQFDVLVNGTGTTVNLATFYGGKRVCLGVKINNGAVSTFINGVPAATGTYTVGSGFNNTTDLSMGCRLDNGLNGYSGQIHAATFNPNALADADIITAQNSLMRSWGIS